VPFPPYKVGDNVRVRATGAVGSVVEVIPKWQSLDVDLGDGITAEFTWDEVEPVTPRPPAN
jgi:hypothetical protein